MKIVNHYPLKASFCAQNADSQSKSNDNQNPISKLGERETLLKGTVVAGFGVGAKTLFYLYDEGFLGEDLIDVGTKLANKKKGPKSPFLYVGAWVAVIGGFIAGVAALYTIFKTPQIMYDGKIKAFTKGKDMDLYTKENDVQVNLYDQMNEKAKNATPDEKKVLAQQYLKLKVAKNPPPDFVDKKQMPNNN